MRFLQEKDKEEIDVQTYDTDQIGQRSAEENCLQAMRWRKSFSRYHAGDRALYFYGCRNLKKAGVLGQSDADRKRSVYSVRKFTETDCFTCNLEVKAV